jgi:hypothetical protein
MAKHLPLDQLQISNTELQALLRTRGILSRSIIRHVDTDSEDRIELKENEAVFNMGNTCNSYECGTAMCIGGWMKLLMLNIRPIAKGLYDISSSAMDSIESYVVDNRPTVTDRPIAALFYPDVKEYETLTAEHAVAAIDNFLTTGAPDWPGVTGREFHAWS